MKKTKLLTSFVTLALALSVGACSTNDDTPNNLEEGDLEQDTKLDKGNDNIVSFFNRLNTDYNYSVELQFDGYVSTESVDFDSWSESDDSSELEESLKLVDAVNVKLYYTENTVEAIIHAHDETSSEYSINAIYMYLNDTDDTVWEYYYLPDPGLGYYHLDGTYSDYRYSMSYFLEEDIQSAFKYEDTKTHDGVEYDLFSIGGIEEQCYFIGLGTDFILNNILATASRYTHQYTAFDEVNQELYTNFNSAGYTLDDDDYPTSVYWVDYECSAHVYDLGTTDDYRVQIVHEYGQQYLEYFD